MGASITPHRSKFSKNRLASSRRLTDRQLLQACFGARVALVGGLFVPLACLGGILRHALTVVVMQAEGKHSFRAALIDGLLVPLARLGVVLRHTLTAGVKGAKANHGIDAALVGGLLV